MTETTLSGPKILGTTNYGQFRRIVGNRPVDPNHLNSLKQSIAANNLLEFDPIKVDKQMGVVDGQHRLEAAKLLHVPIYYVIIPDATFSDVTRLNANLHQWKIEDYVHAWSERGNKEYTTILDFQKRWGLTIPTAIAMLSINGIQKYLKAPYSIVRAGDFKIADLELANDFASFWRSIIPFTEKYTKFSRDFLRALYRVYLNEDFDIDTFIQKLKDSGIKLAQRENMLEYLRMFEDVYNFKQKTLTRLYG